jgi:FtsH-binding integral membrane protein
MIVALIALAVSLMILWQSGVLADMNGWLMTKFLPWVMFPVLFFLGLFWVTDQLSERANLVVAVVLPLLCLLGGVVQVLIAIYQGHMLVINFSTAHDRYTNWSIVPRVVIFGLVYIVLGGMGLYNPRPLQRVFMDHQAGKSWMMIGLRAIGVLPINDSTPSKRAVRLR